MIQKQTRVAVAIAIALVAATAAAQTTVTGPASGTTIVTTTVGPAQSSDLDICVGNVGGDARGGFACFGRGEASTGRAIAASGRLMMVECIYPKDMADLLNVPVCP